MNASANGPEKLDHGSKDRNEEKKDFSIKCLLDLPENGKAKGN